MNTKYIVVAGGIKTILKECLNHKEILFIGATGDFFGHSTIKREKNSESNGNFC